MTERRTVDLDAARAAEDESNGRGVAVILGGHTYTARSPMPVSVAFAAARGDIVAMVQGMFEADEADAIVAAGIDVDELRRVADAMVGGPGE